MRFITVCNTLSHTAPNTHSTHRGRECVVLLLLPLLQQNYCNNFKNYSKWNEKMTTMSHVTATVCNTYTDTMESRNRCDVKINFWVKEYQKLL